MEKSKKAIFAAGCFWGVQEKFDQVPGVVETRVGYAGGQTENPTYEEVSRHTTGHAESIEVTYDPEKVYYDELLEVFWQLHDPTLLNRQGFDIGSNYRSAIFYVDQSQKETAERSKKALEKSKVYDHPIVTEIAPLIKFYPAEDYHQKYYLKHSARVC